MSPGDDRGSGAVLAVAVCGATVALTGALVAACGLLVVHQELTGAADAAALAAADVASGLLPGDPCGVARRVTAANDARLRSCTVAGADAEVAVARTVAGLSLEVAARAGPPRDPLSTGEPGEPGAPG